MRGRSRRWEDYKKDLSITPTKNKSDVRDFNLKNGKTEAEKAKDKEDLLSDWDDTIVSEVIRVANGPI